MTLNMFSSARHHTDGAPTAAPRKLRTIEIHRLRKRLLCAAIAGFSLGTSAIPANSQEIESVRVSFTQPVMKYQRSGPISAIAINRFAPNQVVVAGETGGLFVSGNATLGFDPRGPSPRSGRTWRAVPFPSKAIYDVRFVFNSAGGVRYTFVASAGGSIAKNTTTSGTVASDKTISFWRTRGIPGPSAAWELVPVAGARECFGSTLNTAYRISQDDSGGLVFAATDCGIIQSTDDGETWALMASQPSIGRVFMIENLGGTNVLAGGAAGMSLFNGTAWVAATGNVPSITGDFMRFSARNFSRSAVVAVSQPAGGTATTLHFSTDSGASWGLFGTSLALPGAAGGDLSVSVDLDGVSAMGADRRFSVYVTTRLTAFQANCPLRRDDSVETALERCAGDAALDWTELEPEDAIPDVSGVALKGRGAGGDSRRVVRHRIPAMRISGLEIPARVMTFITSDQGLFVRETDTNNPALTTQWVIDGPVVGLNALQFYDVIGPGETITYAGSQHTSFAYTRDSGTWFMQSNEGYFSTPADNVTGTFPPAIHYWFPAGIGGWTHGHPNALDDSNLQNLVTSCKGSWANLQAWTNPAPITDDYGGPIWLGGVSYLNSTGVGAWWFSNDYDCNWNRATGWPSDFARKGAGIQSHALVGSGASAKLFVPYAEGNDNAQIRLAVLNAPGSATAAWSYPAMEKANEFGVREPFRIAWVGDAFSWWPAFAVDPMDPSHLLAVEAASGRLFESRNDSRGSGGEGALWKEVTNFRDWFEGAVTATGPGSIVLDEVTGARTSAGRKLRNGYGSLAIRSLSFSPFDSRIVIVGTMDDGLFLSKDGGNTWQAADNGLMARVGAFAWRTPDRATVATYGTGLWDIGLSIAYDRPICDRTNLPYSVQQFCNDFPLPSGHVRQDMVAAATSRNFPLLGVYALALSYVMVVPDEANVTSFAATVGENVRDLQRTDARRLIIVRKSQFKEFSAGKALRPIQIPKASEGVFVDKSGAVGFLMRRANPAKIQLKEFPPAIAANPTPPPPTGRTVAFAGGRSLWGMHYYSRCKGVKFEVNGLPPNMPLLVDAPFSRQRLQSKSTQAGSALIDLGPQCKTGIHTVALVPNPRQPAAAKLAPPKPVFVTFSVRTGAGKFFGAKAQQ